MKKSNWLLSTIILAIALAMLSFAISCQKQDTEADIAAIKEVYSQSTLACSTGDAELYLSIFTEDAVVMAPGSPATIGKEELRPIIEGLFGQFDLELPYTVDEVGVPGDWAFVRSSFQYSMTPKESRETTTRAGKELDIFKRQADGSWKIYTESWNYDAPPGAAKLAGTSWEPGLPKRAQDDADAICSEMYHQYELACKGGDVEVYMSLWDDNGVQMPPGAPANIGKEQIRSGMEAAFGAFDLEVPIVFWEAEVAGDWLFGTCTFTESLTPKEGGATTNMGPGKDLWILRRQADGSWKIYIDCWSFDGPPTVE